MDNENIQLIPGNQYYIFNSEGYLISSNAIFLKVYIINTGFLNLEFLENQSKIYISDKCIQNGYKIKESKYYE